MLRKQASRNTFRGAHAVCFRLCNSLGKRVGRHQPLPGAGAGAWRLRIQQPLLEYGGGPGDLYTRPNS